jgi:MoaA/NifB/PqqE/SkfB family radical SAM enzyme
MDLPHCTELSLPRPAAGRRFRVRAGPDGVHLFDRTSGLNVLLDELPFNPRLWAEAPRQVSIALTNACDLGCSHCFAPKHPAVLAPDRVVGWLAELDVSGCLGVGFGGGEPTLYRQLLDLCRYATHETGLAVTFTTHAHHLDGALLGSLAGNVNFVRVSMDGVGTTYEALRGRPFERLRQRLREIRDFVPFGINCVVNSATLPDLDAAAMIAADFGAREFLLLPEQPVHGQGGIDAATSGELQRWVRRYRGPVPLTVSEAGADGLPTCDPLPAEKGLRAYAHIDASGVLRPSSFAADGVAIGADGLMHALGRLRTLQIQERQ